MQTIRYSTETDKKDIQALIESRFGVRESAYEDLENRYLLCFEDDKLIGITGCSKSPRFNGYEIDWTCIAHSAEGKGIITELIRQVIEGVTEDIYCSCWRTNDKSDIHLHHAMAEHGFSPCLPVRIQYDSRYMNCPNECTSYTGKGCHCFEDLYIKKSKK